MTEDKCHVVCYIYHNGCGSYNVYYDVILLCYSTETTCSYIFTPLQDLSDSGLAFIPFFLNMIDEFKLAHAILNTYGIQDVDTI